MSPTKTKEAPPRPSQTATPATAADAPVPTLTPQGVTAPSVTGLGMPELAPPDSEAAGLAAAQAPAGIAAWQSVTVGGLYTSNNQSNAWAYLNGIGWRRISPANATAHHAMLQILRLARDGNITVQCDEDGSVIHTVYVW